MPTPQRRQEIDRIFAAALECEPAARAAFLDEACGGDQQLRKEVESLLANDIPESLVGDHAVEEATRLLAGAEKRASPGDRIGSYLITGSIGTGGMGEVYLAKDRLGRMVALKLLNRHFERDKSGVARFQQEARTLLALNHPHIVTIYDIDQVDSVYYIASELVEGETIRQRLDQGDLDLMVVLEVAIQIATALAAAHEKGIIHRDIKPENIMVRRDGYVKVLDFGIAKLTAGRVTTEPEAPTIRQVQTAEGTVVGTAPYMSPEQARGLPVDARTDIWSLGVLIYESIAGRKPFWGDTTQDVIGSILEKEPPPLSRYAHDVPEGLEWIVSRSLRKEREARYQTANELLFDLKELKRKIEFTKSMSSEAGYGESLPLERVPTSDFRTTARPIPSSNPSSVEYIVTGIKRHRLAFILGLLALAAAIVGLAAYFRARNSEVAIQSIAVMPFVNASGNSDVEYLSDGVTESLINSLSQLPHIKVTARNSVFSYKNQTPNLQQVAQQLNVQALLTGRVLMQGDMLDVRAELTDMQNNTQLWGDHYMRKAADIFSVQDEIARQVTDALRVRLTGGQQEQVTKRYTENAEAYRLYLQGRYYMNEVSEENLNRAVSFFDHAIALDPRYALAYAARGENFFVMGDISLPMSEARGKVEQNIAAALSIDDKLVEARMLRANIEFQYDWNFAKAEEDFKQVIALNPNYAEAHHQYGAFYLPMMGRPMEGVAEMKLAQQLDPVNPSINVDLCLPYYLARQYDQSIAQTRKAIEMFPNFFLPHLALGSALFQKGDYAAGIQEMEKGKAMEPTPHSIGQLGYAYAKSGRKDEARKLLAELKEQSKARYVASYWIAMIYVGLDEKDEAFAWLEKAYQERSWWLVWIKMDPLVDSLRSDSRFTDLMRRIGFPQ